MNKKDLAIVIPVYNAENHLRRTLDSFVKQENNTNLGFHVFIYDDASTDSTCDVLNNYENIDLFTITYIKNNISTGEVRNLGIFKAVDSGYEYIAFCDSDDIMILSEVEKMVTKLRNTNAVYCIGQYRNIDYTSGRYLDNTNEYKGIKFDADNVIDSDINLFSITNASAWNKIYDLNFIMVNKIYFANTYYAEDMAFTYKALATATYKKIIFHLGVMYKYSHCDTKPNSNDKKSIERENDLFSALDNVWEYIEEMEGLHINKVNLFHYLIMSAIGHIRYACNKLGDGTELQVKGFKWLSEKQKILEQYCIDFINNKKSDRKE